MNLTEIFEIAAGTVTGRDHRIAGKNNQDAFCCLANDELIVAVVCDGCGSSPHSEVGAKFGARIVTTEIFATLSDQSSHCCLVQKDDWKFLLACVYNKPFLHQLEAAALGMVSCQVDQESEFAKIIADYFLFTVVGVIITPSSVTVFSAGDGVYGINFRIGGTINTIGPFPQNAPPYPAYGLLGSRVDYDSTSRGFQLQTVQLTRDVQSLLIGTDGAADFIEAAEKNLPGRDELVGRLKQFWENDLYFRNPDALRRRLAVANTDITKPNWEERRLVKYPGLLRDDTTLVVIRRKKQ